MSVNLDNYDKFYLDFDNGVFNDPLNNGWDITGKEQYIIKNVDLGEINDYFYEVINNASLLTHSNKIEHDLINTDFTIEMLVKITGEGQYNLFALKHDNSGVIYAQIDSDFMNIKVNNQSYSFISNTINTIYSNPNFLYNDYLSHLAFCYSSSEKNLAIFINGKLTRVYTTNSSINVNPINLNFSIGWNNNSLFLLKYFRVGIGIVRYTEDFDASILIDGFKDLYLSNNNDTKRIVYDSDNPYTNKIKVYMFG